MDNYLEIARTVLRSSRQPLSARQILKIAHQLQLVPRDLYGRTQQKTLHARLASNILSFRSKSEFYRTEPGRFFLRSFLSDNRIPSKYRREYQASPRAAQLGRFDVIAFPRTALAQLAFRVTSPFPATLLTDLPWRFMRLFGLQGAVDHVPFRFRLLLLSEAGYFVDDQKPTESRDLARRLVVGIPGIVKKSDRSLFSVDGFGLVEAATRTLLEQFESSSAVINALEDVSRWSEVTALVDDGDSTVADLIVFIGFDCSDLTEITEAVDASATRGWLAFNSRPNDLSRFDKWSARLIANQGLTPKFPDRNLYGAGHICSETYC